MISIGSPSDIHMTAYPAPQAHQGGGVGGGGGYGGGGGDGGGGGGSRSFLLPARRCILS